MILDFESSDVRCAATLLRPADVGGRTPCVVMGHGFTGTRDQLLPYAEALAAAGLAVLTFDYRHFGDSDGSPVRSSTSRSSWTTGERRSAWPARWRASTLGESRCGAARCPAGT